MSNDFPRKSLFDTEDRIFFCASLGCEIHLSVALPQSYATSQQKYPVIYLLDGDIYFGMAAGLTPLSRWCLGIPEVIIVGINYDMESYDQFAIQRELDFKIPQIVGAPVDSHADLFLSAITQEMIPFIEANYRANKMDRCLYGYSSSGFFVLYALFHQPDAFQRYLCGSGDFDVAYPYLSQHDDALVTRKSLRPIQLYLTVGALEENQLPYFQEFIAYFENVKISGLSLMTEIFANEPHSAEGVALTYLHGVRSVYKDLY